METVCAGLPGDLRGSLSNEIPDSDFGDTSGQDRRSRGAAQRCAHPCAGDPQAARQGHDALRWSVAKRQSRSLSPMARLWNGRVVRMILELDCTFSFCTLTRCINFFNVVKGGQPLYLKSVPRPLWDAEAVRHVIGGVVIARHRCLGRPGEVIVQHLSQSTVAG